MEQENPLISNMSAFETQVLQFMAHINQRLEQVETVQAVHQATPPTVTPVPFQQMTSANFNLGKIAKKPNAYDGERKASVLKSWKLAMETYLHLCGVPSEQWVLTASTYLSGQASTWFAHWYSQHSHSNWESLTTALETHFVPSTAKTDALDRLARLRQMGSVESYARLFRTIAEEIPESESKDYELKCVFIRNLKPEVQVQVRLQDFDDTFSWDRIEEIALQVDSILFRKGKFERKILPIGSAAPMDLDNIDLAKYRQEKRCFKCGQTRMHAPGCISKYRFNTPKPNFNNVETQADKLSEERKNDCE